MNYLIVIPALNPGGGLTEYVDSLIKRGYKDILVIDDGSRDEFRHVFDELEIKKGCRILRHDINLGKGRALKDAMAYYLDNLMDCQDMDKRSDGIITVDSDGQHTVEDVEKVADAMTASPDALILGARDFDNSYVPPKSRFGNKCTYYALKMFIGGNIHDTQTGLRGIPACMIRRFSALSGERFEYETVMLIDAIRSGYKIVEVPIKTVYINDNSETHFRPIKDSVRIYSIILGTFFKYMLSSLSSFVVDYALFCGLFYMLGKTSLSDSRSIWTATVISRICSSLFNYTVNKKVVFKSRRGPVTIVMYYILCVLQMSASAALVSLINMQGLIPVQLAKIIVDCILFLISFRIQNGLIFKDAPD